MLTNTLLWFDAWSISCITQTLNDPPACTDSVCVYEGAVLFVLFDPMGHFWNSVECSVLPLLY